MTCTSNQRAIESNQSPMRHVHRKLSYRGEDRGCVVGNTDCKSGAGTETREALDAGEIEAQSRRSDLHAETCFGLRFGAERTIAGSRVRAAIHFTGNAELFVHAKDSRGAVSQHVVLRKELCRRGQDCD